MYCLIDFCCICLYNKAHLQPLSDSDSDNITYFIKLMSCVPEMYFNEINDRWFVCHKCCETMNAAYKFRQRCLRRKITLTNYISQLHQISNVSGRANVYLTDINKLSDIRKEYQKENIEKTRMFLKVEKDVIQKENFEINPTIAIKRENDPNILKLNDTEHNYIQLGNVIIKMEGKNQNSEEHIEESFDNLSINQDDIKFDVSQNHIKLTTSAIKEKDEKQDFEEHLHERFNYILQTRDSENGDMMEKIEENNDYPLYLEKCLDNPLTNLDEIKIDIVDNYIETVNGQINIYYKNEDISEFLTEDNIPLEGEDNTDKDASSCRTATQEASTSKSFKFPDISNRIVEAKKSDTIIHPESKQLECNIYDKKSNISTNLRHHMKTHNEEKLHKCNVCKKKFTESFNLKQHMRIHTEEKQHKCSVCHKKFMRPVDLRVHMRIHTGEKPHECSVCQKKFTQVSSLKEHMKIHTGEKPHECSVCQKKFMRPVDLRLHMRIHTGEKPNECDVCQKKFSQSSSLREHMKIHTGQNSHECNVCQKKFTQLSYLKIHMKNHTGKNLHECSVCQKKFAQAYTLKIHMKIHTGEKIHECNICHKKCIQLSSLKQHMRIHTGEKPHECSVCLKKFTQSSSLREHKKIHTGEKSHECSVCHKKYTQLSNLKKHIRVHTPEKPYDCSVCQQKFIYFVDLKKHMRTHTTEKPHECCVCQKKFTLLTHLKHHMGIHIVDKQQECNVCQQKFTCSVDLNNHMKDHTDGKLYECNICQRKFSRSCYLKKHMKIYTDENLHKCNVCQKKFILASNLKVHMKIHIRENSQEYSVRQEMSSQSFNLSKHTKCHSVQIRPDNVVHNMERKYTNCEVSVEESIDNILVSQEKTNNDVKFTVTAIKKEDEYQDSEEYSKESFNNVLQTCDSENNTETKVEENCSYPFYLQNCSDDSLTNLEKIKIDDDEDFEVNSKERFNNTLQICDSENNMETKVEKNHQYPFYLQNYTNDSTNLEKIKIDDDVYQDFEENSDERFNNILQTFDSENNMETKVEENHGYPFYLQNCSDDSLTSLEKIKIDIVDNDMKLVNDGINIQYETEEFSTEDNVITFQRLR